MCYKMASVRVWWAKDRISGYCDGFRVESFIDVKNATRC